MKKTIFAFLAAAAASSACCGGDYPYRPADMTNVSITSGFWLPRLETNRLSTVRTDFAKCEETGRIGNFEAAADGLKTGFKGIPFDDSDVFKVIEGAAYTLATHPDPELEAYLDKLIEKIAGAQEPDGYLYTARSLNFNADAKHGKRGNWLMGPVRWSHVVHSHEMYNAGHLYEAAVAYFEATGKRRLLDVAIRNADLIDRTFGPGATQLKDPPGHEEIELALCKLYRATGEERYLELARFLLEARGRGKAKKATEVFTQSGDKADGTALGAPGAYAQDHLPVTMQREAVGHAVRAAYLYCGMADVAVLSKNEKYIEAIDAIWENVVSKKLHLNGSIGARHHGEAFGANYELPNETAYLETCAGIGNALWNQRMFLLHGDAKYIDILELAAYNGIISGVSLGGDEFFYPNPLASKGGYARSKWFGCSCCPVNVVRFLPQIAQFAYATREDSAYVNLFVESEATLRSGGLDVKITQKTDYPWSGESRIEVKPAEDGAKFALHVRVPGWCTGAPVPGDLYEQTVPGSLADFKVRVNGKDFAFEPRKGYCVIEREWKSGDAVEVSMAMPVRRVKANDAVEADRGRLAVMCGPILYCAEGVDNGGRVLDKIVAADAEFKRTTCDILGNVYPAYAAPAVSLRRGIRKTTAEKTVLKLVPYFAWCHRGAGEMQTWFPAEPLERFAANGAKVSASHCFANDRTSAISDGVLPKSSSDHSVPRHTFWDHRGTKEWIVYELPAPEKTAGIDIYWFDDGNRGFCRLPASWKAQWRESADAPWKDAGGEGEIAKDKLCGLDFAAPVEAQAVRVEVQLQDGMSGGVLEMKLR